MQYDLDFCDWQFYFLNFYFWLHFNWYQSNSTINLLQKTKYIPYITYTVTFLLTSYINWDCTVFSYVKLEKPEAHIIFDKHKSLSIMLSSASPSLDYQRHTWCNLPSGSTYSKKLFSCDVNGPILLNLCTSGWVCII